MSSLAAPRSRSSRWARARASQDDAVAGALAALVVLPLGLSDGGYFGRSLTALTVALLAATALKLLADPAALQSRPLLVASAALGLLTVWVAVSSRWAPPGTDVAFEARRCALYTAGLLAIAATVGFARRRAFVVSLALALVVLPAVGLVARVASGVSLDPFYGSLLSEPVGYPNAMGVLAAMATALAIGLGAGAAGVASRPLRGLAPFLVLVLGLTGSRGGMVALVAGLVALVALTEKAARWPVVGLASSSLAIGGAAWALTLAAGSEGLVLVTASAAAIAAGVSVPTLGRRGAISVVACVAAVAAAVVLTRPPSTTSSYRAAYWTVALEAARQAPVLGTGAGSFSSVWREHRPVDVSVRDAHSLYVETLSELGPLGLALVLVALAVPLGAAIRRRGDPIIAAAGAAFAVYVVHAGVDWDWEIPVVTLVALGCAGVLVSQPSESKGRDDA